MRVAGSEFRVKKMSATFIYHLNRGNCMFQLGLKLRSGPGIEKIGNIALIFFAHLKFHAIIEMDWKTR